MEIYNDYISKIKSAMNSGSKATQFSNFSGTSEDIQKGFDIGAIFLESNENRPLPSLMRFADEYRLSPNSDQKLGAHPDFSHLKQTNQFEKHNIVSVFIDIKGSTNLFKKYFPETVFVITNLIQRAAIHTCLVFGGYIQRLQGDGLFVYFGGKNIDPNSAIENALKATSTFSYFVKNDLKKVFDQQGVENIKTRIGIDFGEDDDVVWAMAGVGEISEITTCSLHTSLASKMQSYAESNGIVAGFNVVSRINPVYFTPVSKRTERDSDRYIFQIPEDGFYYAQYDFNWLKYLKSQDFIATDLNDEIHIKNKNVIVDIDKLQPIAQKNTPYLNGEKA